MAYCLFLPLHMSANSPIGIICPMSQNRTPPALPQTSSATVPYSALSHPIPRQPASNPWHLQITDPHLRLQDGIHLIRSLFSRPFLSVVDTRRTSSQTIVAEPEITASPTTMPQKNHQTGLEARLAALDISVNAVTAHFDTNYGTNDSKLEAWQQLCRDIGVNDKGTSVTQCKKVRLCPVIIETTVKHIMHCYADSFFSI